MRRNFGFHGKPNKNTFETTENAIAMMLEGMAVIFLWWALQ